MAWTSDSQSVTLVRPRWARVSPSRWRRTTRAYVPSILISMVCAIRWTGAPLTGTTKPVVDRRTVRAVPDDMSSASSRSVASSNTARSQVGCEGSMMAWLTTSRRCARQILVAVFSSSTRQMPGARPVKASRSGAENWPVARRRPCSSGLPEEVCCFLGLGFPVEGGALAGGGFRPLLGTCCHPSSVAPCCAAFPGCGCP
eukprot:6459048-Amphidinium_carterae.4